MGLFDGIFNNSTQEDAAAQQTAGLQAAYTQASGAVNAGQTTTNADYATALAPTTTNLSTDQAGQTAYANATGVNGAAGYADAMSSFNTDPGYDWAMDQGTQAVMRNQAATGQLASGGTNVDLQNYAQGQADQQWQQYVTNLQPFIGASTTNAQTAGAIGSSQATTDANAASQLANLAWSENTGIGNANANATLAGAQTNANTLNAGMNAASALMMFI